MRFSYKIDHIPGKKICTADTLSRAPDSESDKADTDLQTEVNTFVNIVMENLLATAEKLQKIKSCQDEDPVCQQIKKFCQEGWPTVLLKCNLIPTGRKTTVPIPLARVFRHGCR